jgi:hypothetical protein
VYGGVASERMLSHVMKGVVPNVFFTVHTLERALERGTSRAEIADVLATGFAIPAHSGRRGKAKVYDFQERRNGIEYPQKRVEVYYIDAGDALFAVTVYVFYGKWETK